MQGKSSGGAWKQRAKKAVALLLAAAHLDLGWRRHWQRAAWELAARGLVITVILVNGPPLGTAPFCLVPKVR